jgi:hypothetical protein
VDSNAFLDPADSPDGMPAVRRLNHIPLYVLGGIAVVIMLIIVMVAYDKSKTAAAPAEDHGGNTDSFAQQAAGNAYGYIPAARTPTPFPSAAPIDSSTPAPTPDAEAGRARRRFMSHCTRLQRLLTRLYLSASKPRHRPR